jgi:hypothetical protein
MHTRWAGWLTTAGVVLSSGCSTSPATLSDARALAIHDSVQAALAAYADRANVADGDSLLHFYRNDPRFLWAANGKVGTHSVSEMRTAFAGLAPYRSWRVEYKNPVIRPLAPGLASVATEYTQHLVDSTGKTLTYGGPSR